MARGTTGSPAANRLPVSLAALLSAIPFGIAHIQPEHILYAAAVGFLLALLYQRFRSLWASIAAHMAINLLASELPVHTPVKTCPPPWGLQ